MIATRAATSWRFFCTETGASRRPDKGTSQSEKGVVAVDKEYVPPAGEILHKPACALIAVVEPSDLFFVSNISLELRDSAL
jgi:hypothetical protein